MKFSRRRFIALIGAIGAGAALSGAYATISLRRSLPPRPVEGKAKVYLIAAKDRREGVKRLMEQFPINEYRGETVALKANFNSADPFPASTHIETLRAVVEELKEADVAKIDLAERSGMGRTRKVLEVKGVFALSKKLGFKVTVLDEIDKTEWLRVPADGTHWLNGFPIAKTFLNSDRVIQICCLKTHRFGGHFTMSLKNSVGIVAKRLPGDIYDYMVELHSSPFQRLMIAEINRFYNVDLVLMDAMKAFVKGGPERGEVVEPNLMLASKDRVAIDAVGVAILRLFGSTKEVMEGRIFELEQIKRAAELGVGVNAPGKIELIPLNEGGQEAADGIERILKTQG